MQRSMLCKCTALVYGSSPAGQYKGWVSWDCWDCTGIASFLEDCSDVVSYAKNYLAVHFKLDYVNRDGDISNYYPDFFVKLSDGRIVVVETKGQEDLDVPLKTQRLRQWCEDINATQSEVTYDFVYVDQEGFEKYAPKSFSEVLAGFREYKET
ncbi:MAG: hypothetical protein WED00_00920 [Aquisalimonadaceae bacterium]